VIDKEAKDVIPKGKEDVPDQDHHRDHLPLLPRPRILLDPDDLNKKTIAMNELQ
jgi:hypothetical protein